MTARGNSVIINGVDVLARFLDTIEALREMEWGRMKRPVWGGSHNELDIRWGDDLPSCPVCGGLKPGSECWDWVPVGHRDDCKLAQTIEEATK